MRLGFCLALLALAGQTASAADITVSVDQIEIEGVKVISPVDAQSAIEVSPGDNLERAKIVRSARNLQTIYYVKGYQDVGVKSDLVRRKTPEGQVETILRFIVTEGKPTRIGKIQVTPLIQKGKGQEDRWLSLQRELLSKIPLKPGDILDQDRISEARRALESDLASQEFVGARASDVRLNISDTPAVPALAGDTERWYDIDFRVDLGDRVTFGFRGNQAQTRNELMNLVEAQKTAGFGADYVSTIRARIEDSYRAMGYAQVKVTAMTFENTNPQSAGVPERHVTYVIDEGPRVKIDSVVFDGNTVFTGDQLRSEFFDHAPYLVQKGFYVEKDVDRATQLLAEWLQSKGYLFAKTISVNRTFFGPDDAKVRLLIYVNEGEQTVIKSIDLDGVGAISQEQSRIILGIHENTPLDLFALSEGIEKLKAEYKSMGYLDMALLNEQEDSVVRYSNHNRQADITLKVKEGYRFRVGEIKIYGLERTYPNIVKRELQFKEGDYLESWALNDTEKRLRRLGIFATVSLDLKDSPNRPGFKDVNVIVQEGSAGRIGGGLGFRNDLGVRVFGETSYANLWHRNHTWALTANANRRFVDYCRNGVCFAEYQVKMGYAWPWFIVNEMTLRPELTQERHRYYQFDADTTEMSVSVERRLLKYVNLVGNLQYSLERTRQYNAVFTTDDQTLLIGGITPSLRLDLRDDPLAPTKGFYSTVSYEIANTTFGSQSSPFPIGYTRAQLRTDYTVPLAPKVSWYLSFRTGIERNTVNPVQNGVTNPLIGIPLIKQFALGGINSLRGFQFQELNLQNINITGTASYVNYRTQVDFPLVGDLRFGPFLDAGNLLVDKYSFGGLRYGTGAGLHYMTPVGPVNFDWGFKIDPQPGESTNEFYFSLGTI